MTNADKIRSMSIDELVQFKHRIAKKWAKKYGKYYGFLCLNMCLKGDLEINK